MIIFREKDHAYINSETKERLTSVTTRIKEFEHPFEEQEWANIKAEEFNVTPEKVLGYWNYLSTFSSLKGTLVHFYMENLWNHKLIDVQIPSIVEKFTTLEYVRFHLALNKCMELGKKFFLDHYERFETRKTERIVYNEKYAGQIDLDAFDKQVNLPKVIDWKTDQEIKFDNSFNNFKEPFHHLPQCNYVKYGLQTNCYRVLLDEPTSLPWVVWLNEDNDSYKIFELDDYTKYAKILMT